MIGMEEDGRERERSDGKMFNGKGKKRVFRPLLFFSPFQIERVMIFHEKACSLGCMSVCSYFISVFAFLCLFNKVHFLNYIL